MRVIGADILATSAGEWLDRHADRVGLVLKISVGRNSAEKGSTRG